MRPTPRSVLFFALALATVAARPEAPRPSQAQAPPAPAASPQPSPQPVSTPAAQPAPTPVPLLNAAPSQRVRIGLTNDPVKVRVFADGGLVVRDPVKHAPIWKKRFEGGVYLVSELSGTETGLLYRVQIASYASKDQAEAKQVEIQGLLAKEKTVLSYNPDRKSWRV
ncbi:MAG TPA: hypothetical protein VGA64_11605, partial [Candidatus Polarisedimenticolia bacterium]